MSKRKKPQPTPAELGLAEIMKSANGRAFLWERLESARVFNVSFDPITPSRTFFNEGARNEGLKLLAQIQAADINGFVQMQLEAAQRTRVNDDAREHQRVAEFGSGVGSDDGNDNDDGSNVGNEG